MLRELRIYELGPGGEVHVVRRLTEYMPSLFAAHGFRPVGQWLAIGGRTSSAFIWMLHWPDWNARAAAFDALYADPGFAAAVAATQPDGPWLTRFHVLFLTPSVAHPASSGDVSGTIDELCLDEVVPGTATCLSATMRDEGVVRIGAAGGTLLGHFDVVSGWPLQCFAHLTRWPTRDIPQVAGLEGVTHSTRWLLRPLEHCRATVGLA